MGGHSEHKKPFTLGTGEPTPYISDPTQTSVSRCKRRWNDLVLLRVDALSPQSYSGKDARFSDKTEMFKLIRERYLLFAQCLESKPGQEPKHPYLYPQANVNNLS